MTDAPAALSRWQTPDGWPTDDYLAAVETALDQDGITVKHGWRDEDYDAVIVLADNIAAEIGYETAWIGWRVGEGSDPLADQWQYGGGACGWYFVPASDRQAGGDRVEEVAVELFEDPADVADAVKTLLEKLKQE
jgi:hypothetical protein